MDHSTKFLFSLVLLILLPLSVCAQMRNSNEVKRPSADAWNMIEYGKVSPSLYTGTLHLSIPLYTYEDNDFSIPINLDYATDGFLPNDPEGVLGPGWTLNVGGCVTREVKGIPDEQTNAVLLDQQRLANVKGFNSFSNSNH